MNQREFKNMKSDDKDLSSETHEKKTTVLAWYICATRITVEAYS